ncbi:MAG: hypothetical protein ACOVKC_08820 [Brevundimonas sp.]
MILYQKRTLSPAANVGDPGPLPAFLVGLADVSLADLPAALDPGAVVQLGLTNTGYLPVDVPDPVVVPAKVSMMQAQLALAGAGLLDDVETAIAGADTVTQIYWRTASDLHRQHPLVLTLAGALGLTSEQVDDLFIAAVSIT